MSYAIRKIFLAAFCGAFILGGLFFSLRALLWGENLDNIVFPVPFIVIASVVLITQWRQISRFQTMTYQWYCQTYPMHAQSGRLSCFACGGTKVHVRGLMNQTYHREHFCQQCGKTLYFSPEQG